MAYYDGAKPWEEKIPDCTFISFETGGHLMEGNSAVITEELAKFVGRTK